MISFYLKPKKKKKQLNIQKNKIDQWFPEVGSERKLGNVCQTVQAYSYVE